MLEAADLLNQAVTQDPSFFQAYCQLAHTHDRIYFLGYDHTPARLAMAEAAIQSAFRLRPDAGEAHLARAQNLYRGHFDYDAALAELDVAAKTLPNDTAVFELKGYIQRRQGKQEEAVRSLERAIELDPRNTFTLQQIGLSYASSPTLCRRKIGIGPRVGRRGERCRYESRTCIRGLPLESRYPASCIKRSIQFGPQILPPRKVSPMVC